MFSQKKVGAARQMTPAMIAGIASTSTIFMAFCRKFRSTRLSCKSLAPIRTSINIKTQRNNKWSSTNNLVEASFQRPPTTSTGSATTTATHTQMNAATNELKRPRFIGTPCPSMHIITNLFQQSDRTSADGLLHRCDHGRLSNTIVKLTGVKLTGKIGHPPSAGRHPGDRTGLNAGPAKLSYPNAIPAVFLSLPKTAKQWSERRDLNSRPPVPQTGALTGLRYAPPCLALATNAPGRKNRGGVACLPIRTRARSAPR